MPCRPTPFSATPTLNIGVIEGGRAPNVISDAAKAEISIRLVGDPIPFVKPAARRWRCGTNA